MQRRTVNLRECSCLQTSGVAEGEPVLQRVKVLGWESKNRRQYLYESVEVGQYEGLLVNLNHPASPTDSRRIEDRFGRLLGVTKEGDGLWSNLRYNPAHPMAEQIKWAAINDPGLFGLSHNAVGTGKTKDGVFVVERVVAVKSVDLVADPATTQGLYESMDETLDYTPADAEGGGDSVEEKIGHLILAILKDDGLDADAKKKKVLLALKLCDDKEEGDGEKEDTEETYEDDESDEGDGDGEGEEEDKEDKMEESLKQLASTNAAVKKLVEEVDALKAEKALAARHALAVQMCEAAKLPKLAVTDNFLGQLIEAKDEKAMKALIEDRKAVASIQKPRSTGSVKDTQKMDLDTFVKTMKGGR